MKEIDFSKAPEGATHYQGSSDDCVLWVSYIGDTMMVHNCGIWKQVAIKGVRPIPPQPWNGKGLPPVGCECEFLHPDFGWVGCDVIAHYGGAVACAPNGGGFYGAEAPQLRQMRTPEEAAAEVLRGWVCKSNATEIVRAIKEGKMPWVEWTGGK